MRLKRVEIEKVSNLILKNLIKKDLVALETEEGKVFAKIKDIFINELMVEDILNEEVRKIMDSHQHEIESGSIDYNKMFEMIKKKLIEGKNIII